jgi:hypothetical protein
MLNHSHATHEGNTAHDASTALVGKHLTGIVAPAATGGRLVRTAILSPQAQG